MVIRRNIERKAAYKVVDLCADIGVNMVGAIPVDEKGVSFDGNIEVFNDDNESKENLIDFVPVQVKGVTVKKFSRKNAKQQVFKDDLVVFRKQDGVLFIRGEVEESTRNVKLFYKLLLNLDIDHIMSYMKRNSVQIDMKPFETGMELRSICLSFLNEQYKQTSNVMGLYSIKNLNGFGELKLVPTTLVDSTDEKNFINKQFYIYGFKDGLWFPVTIGRLDSIAEQGEFEESYEGISERFSYKRITGTDHQTDIIEEAIFIRVSKDENGRLFNPRHTLNFDYIKSINHLKKCLISAVKTMERWERFLKDTDNPSDLANIKDYMQYLRDLADDMKELEALFEEIGISLDEEIYPFRSGGIVEEYYDALSKIFLDGDLRPINRKEKDDLVTNLTLGNHMIMVLLVYREDKVEVISPTNKSFNDFYVLYEKPTEKSFKITPLLLQNPEWIFKPLNVSKEFVFSSFAADKVAYTDSTYGNINNFALQLIDAYDKSSNRDYLDLAILIFDNLANVDSKSSQDLAYMNKLQCQLRLGHNLDESEEDRLLSIRDSTTGALIVTFGCHALLGNKADARRVASRMNEEERRVLETYPIYKFYTKM